MKTFLIFIGIMILLFSVVCAGIGCYGRKRYREGYDKGYVEGYEGCYLHIIRQQMRPMVKWSDGWSINEN